MVKAQNVDIERLNNAIDKSGLKNSYFSEKLGISKQAWSNKRRGVTSIRGSEVFVLCVLLHLEEDEAEKIFFP